MPGGNGVLSGVCEDSCSHIGNVSVISCFSRIDLFKLWSELLDTLENSFSSRFDPQLITGYFYSIPRHTCKTLDVKIPSGRNRFAFLVNKVVGCKHDDVTPPRRNKTYRETFDKKMVSEGMGVAVISKSACEDYCQFGMVLAFDFDNISLRRKLYILKHKNSILSPIAQVFYEFAKDFYRK